MTDTTHKQPKERSRSFPVIPLKGAIDRLQQFEKKFGRHPAPYEKAGLAWGMEEGSSQANRILAALKSFNLIEYTGSGKERTVGMSESGRTYLRAQQDSIKREILRAAALKPKQIAHFWPQWGIDRPPNEICLDRLVLKEGFTDASAPQFLRVYDETIAFAGLVASDKVEAVEADDDDDADEEKAVISQPTSHAEVPRRAQVVQSDLQPSVASTHTSLGQGERVLTTGLLSKDTSFKLIVSGHVGVKELERLIKKLELDKEILAEPDDDPLA